MRRDLPEQRRRRAFDLAAPTNEATVVPNFRGPHSDHSPEFVARGMPRAATTAGIALSNYPRTDPADQPVVDRSSCGRFGGMNFPGVRIGVATMACFGIAPLARAADGPVTCTTCHANQSVQLANSIHKSLRCGECHKGPEYYTLRAEDLQRYLSAASGAKRPAFAGPMRCRSTRRTA